MDLFKKKQTPTRWLPCRNGNATLTVPAFGCVRVTNAGADGLLTVDRPASDGGVLAFNGPSPIPPQGYGHVTADCPVFALYDGADGTPAPGDAWGAGCGVYSLRKGKAGYVVWGVGASGGVGLAMVMPAAVPPAPFVSNVCPIFGTAAAPGGGTMQVMTGVVVETTAPDGTTTCVTNPTGCCTCCAGVEVPSQLCLTVTGATNSCLVGSYLLTNAGVGYWQGTYPSSCGPHSLLWTLYCTALGWNVDLAVDGTGGGQLNIPVVCSPFSATFSIPSGTWPDIGTTTITGTVSSTITACGSGSGSGSGGGVITTACCPSDPLPPTLHAHVSGSGVYDGSHALTYDGVGAWSAGGLCTLSLSCDGGGLFHLLVAGSGHTPDSVSCSPFQVVFTSSFVPCGGNPAATVTILLA